MIRGVPTTRVSSRGRHVRGNSRAYSNLRHPVGDEHRLRLGLSPPNLSGWPDLNLGPLGGSGPISGRCRTAPVASEFLG